MEVPELLKVSFIALSDLKFRKTWKLVEAISIQRPRASIVAIVSNTIISTPYTSQFEVNT